MAIVTEGEMESEGVRVPLRAPLLDRPLRGLLTWERALGVLAVLVLLAVASRFWMLGERALHHDESLHAVYSYYLFNAGNYQHQPMMHGPLLFHLTAFGYWLFGDTDFTARLAPALLGVFLVWVPWKFRGWLGTRGALATSALMLISPVMLYYSRFIREDIFAAAWTVIIVYGMWAYLSGGRLFHLYLMVVGWALLFSQKEISFMLAFIFWLYLAAALVWRWWRARREERPFVLRDEREWALLVVLGALLLPFLTAVIMHLPTVINRTFGTMLPIWDPGAVGGNSETSVYNSAVSWPEAFKWRAYLTIMALTSLGVALAARFWRLREYLVAAALFFGIIIVLHTTFLTNPHGIGSGIVGSLGYWIEQHDVARGEQPWYYYAMLLPLYEFLPLLITAVGGPLLLWKRAQRRGATRTAGSAIPDRGRGWFAFLIWWTVAAFALFSYAGEKMPWLLVHLALPLIFLAGAIIGRTLGDVDFRRLRRGEAALIGLLVLTLVLALTTLVVMLLDGVAPFRGMDEMNLLATARWLLTALFLLGAGWGLTVLAERFTRAQVAQIAAIALLLPLVAATVRFATIASFHNADTANEPLIFVQTTPAMTRFVRELEDLSERLTGGRDIAIAYDNESSWPFEWYLRHFPNRFFYGSAPQSYTDAMRNADVVIAGDANWQTVQPFVTGYVTHEYKMRWWFPEAYKKLTERVDPATGATAQDPGLPNVLSRLRGYAEQPQYRADFLDFLLNRRVKEPLGGMGVRIYYKPEIAARVWNATPSTQPAEAEEDIQTVEAARVVAGSFEMPRAVAALPDGRMAVADTRANSITILGADGAIEGRFGSFGAEAGQFNEPWGIAAAPDGTLYIADTWNHRVVHVTTEGETLHAWGGFADTSGAAQGAEGLFWGPRAVAVGPEGDVWVTDTGNARVQRFTADGTFVAQFGGRGAEAGQLNEPVGIAVAPDGTIWVADTWNQRVQGFDAAGVPLVQIPLDGWAGEGVDNKPSIAASADRLWVTDPEQALVIEFDRAGTRLRAWGGFGSGPAQLALPGGLAFRDGELWVADAGNARVAIFEAE